MSSWLFDSWYTVAWTVGSVFCIFSLMIVVVRVAGLRTFAKMSSIDFATTIAIGSILASVVMNKNASLTQGVAALVAIVVFQQIFAGLKVRSDDIENLLENNPTLLMRGSMFLYGNMQKTGVSRSDLIAKLREANVLRLDQVKAVVLETTGDISVLHAEDDGDLEDVLLEGVER